jgi:hypothetical protein
VISVPVVLGTALPYLYWLLTGEGPWRRYGFSSSVVQARFRNPHPPGATHRPKESHDESVPLLDCAGRRRSPTRLPGYARAGQHGTKGFSSLLALRVSVTYRSVGGCLPRVTASIPTRCRRGLCAGRTKTHQRTAKAAGSVGILVASTGRRWRVPRCLLTQPPARGCTWWRGRARQLSLTHLYPTRSRPIRAIRLPVRARNSRASGVPLRTAALAFSDVAPVGLRSRRSRVRDLSSA